MRRGSRSWTALSGALVESRKAFDRASKIAYDAVKRAAGPQGCGTGTLTLENGVPSHFNCLRCGSPEPQWAGSSALPS